MCVRRAKGFGRPNAAKLFMHGLMSHIPMRFLDLLYCLPDPGLAFLKRHVDLSSALSRKLIAERTDGAVKGNALGSDALSLIVKANSHEKGRWRLGDEELVPQFACPNAGSDVADLGLEAALQWVEVYLNGTTKRLSAFLPGFNLTIRDVSNMQE